MDRQATRPREWPRWTITPLRESAWAREGGGLLRYETFLLLQKRQRDIASAGTRRLGMLLCDVRREIVCHATHRSGSARGFLGLEW